MMYRFTDNERIVVMKFEDDGKCYVSFQLVPECSYHESFKKDVLAGAELQDSEGVAMTQQQADDFIKTLP